MSSAFKWAGCGLMVLGVAADIYDTATSTMPVKTAVTDAAGLAGA